MGLRSRSRMLIISCERVERRSAKSDMCSIPRVTNSSESVKGSCGGRLDSSAASRCVVFSEDVRLGNWNDSTMLNRWKSKRCPSMFRHGFFHSTPRRRLHAHPKDARMQINPKSMQITVEKKTRWPFLMTRSVCAYGEAERHTKAERAVSC